MNSDRGLIGFFGLTEWFDNLTPGEKQKISDYYFMPVDVSFQISVSQSNLEEDISIIELGDPTEHINNMSPRLTREGFLQLIGSNAIIVKDYDFAEKILEKALENMEIDPITRHFIYNSLIDCFYSLRNIDDKALLKCIKYCWEDIKFLNDFLIAYKKKEEQQLQWIKENLEEGEENAYLNKNLNEGIIYPGIPSLQHHSQPQQQQIPHSQTHQYN